MTEPGNVLLACESDACPLNATKLTWVVGAAIRSTAVRSASDVGALLKRLGETRPFIRELRFSRTHQTTCTGVEGVWTHWR